MKTLSLSAVSDDISICTKMENFLWFPVLWVISSMYRDENCGHPQSGVVGLSREGPRSLTCPRHRSPVSFSSALMTREPSDAETSKMKACSDQPGSARLSNRRADRPALTMPWNTSSTIACAAQRGTPASLRRRRPVRSLRPLTLEIAALMTISPARQNRGHERTARGGASDRCVV